MKEWLQHRAGCRKWHGWSRYGRTGSDQHKAIKGRTVKCWQKPSEQAQRDMWEIGLIRQPSEHNITLPLLEDDNFRAGVGKWETWKLHWYFDWSLNNNALIILHPKSSMLWYDSYYVKIQKLESRKSGKERKLIYSQCAAGEGLYWYHWLPEWLISGCKVKSSPASSLRQKLSWG